MVKCPSRLTLGLLLSSQANGTELINFVYGYTSWAGYLQDVKAGGTWGDEIVLFAAANCFHVPIRVVSSLPNHDDVYIPPESPAAENTDPLVLGHIHEEHYVSLHPVQPGKVITYGIYLLRTNSRNCVLVILDALLW